MLFLGLSFVAQAVPLYQVHTCEPLVAGNAALINDQAFNFVDVKLKNPNAISWVTIGGCHYQYGPWFTADEMDASGVVWLIPWHTHPAGPRGYIAIRVDGDGDTNFKGDFPNPPNPMGNPTASIISISDFTAGIAVPAPPLGNDFDIVPQSAPDPEIPGSVCVGYIDDTWF